MKVVILSVNNQREIIEHFISYGYDDFVVFNGKKEISENDMKYYSLNGIRIVQIKRAEGEDTSFSLSKIKGSLTKRFFLVYSWDICFTDIDRALAIHKSSQVIATLIQINGNKSFISAAIFEEELFDYVSLNKRLEGDVLKELCGDMELTIINYNERGCRINNLALSKNKNKK